MERVWNLDLTPSSFHAANDQRSPRRLGKALATSLKATDYDVHRSLDFVGEIIDDQIRTSIREGSFAPISERTLEARLASSKRTGTLKSVNMETACKPLVDTGLMLGSVSHEVSDD
ncbi:hypothetical protein [Asaia sp. HumB]|uniref:hypothetical protein n=1 Tax=Asaia sp. HumB TaxID=3035475 RepID=UPI0025521D0D|nr:hypothetical protein [Asaia sp. HumB]MDL2169812.1 hypothetical protein [Asaia sp. HumB]